MQKTELPLEELRVLQLFPILLPLLSFTHGTPHGQTAKEPPKRMRE